MLCKKFPCKISDSSPPLIFIFILSVPTGVMLILILIDVQYSEKAIFSFEKGSNGQNIPSSGSQHPVKKVPCKISETSPPFNAIWKTLVHETG